MALETTRVRPADVGDLPRILEIYNREVLVSTATYDTVPRTPEEHDEWFGHHGPRHPVIVAESGDGESDAHGGAVLGWASLSPWAERAAYDRSVEVSVYVAEEARRQGVGKLLLQALIDEARRLGHHAVLARISADNTVSIRLHAALGFSVVGTLKEVGYKFGRMLDVCIMEMVLPESRDAPEDGSRRK